jgi:tRNA(fMet)-specific endonuclease VapC
MLDTNICIYIIKNKPLSVKKRFKMFSVNDIFISSITVCELMYGAYKSKHVEQNLKVIESFLVPFEIKNYDYEASVRYGDIRTTLEKQGKVIGSLDMLIAAHAQSLNATLVTNNLKEFQRIENLELDNWVD